MKEWDKYATVVGDFNTLCSKIGRTSRQKIIKYIGDLNKIINQLDLLGICRILYPITAEYYL